MDIRPINKDEILEAKKLSSICFEYPFLSNKQEDEFVDEILSSPSQKGDVYWEQIYGAFDEQQNLMSCLNVIPFEFYFDGNTVKGTGIGNVVTYPHHRKKGAIKGIFQTILPIMYQNKVAFSYLYPFSESFYRKYGYERSCSPIGWNFDLRTVPSYRYDGSFHLHTDDSDLELFKITYEKFASPFNMMVKRDCYDWDSLKEAKASYNNNYAYLYKNAQNQPAGYIIFKRQLEHDEPILNCREIVFDSYETLKAIMSFMSTYGSDYKRIHFYCPSHISLEDFCTDFAQSSTYLSIGSNGMVRAVHVPTVLKQAAYLGSGTISIKLSDNYILENNGIFTVAYQDGKAITVEKDILEEFDIALNISTFSSAIVGNYTTEQLLLKDDVLLHSDTNKINHVFYKKPNWINNYF